MNITINYYNYQNLIWGIEGLMDRFNRIFALHKILSTYKYPVSRKTIEEKLECSKATVNRIIEEMRDFLGAPIEYNRQLNGYEYAKTDGHPYDLPGLWFNPSEIYALLACQELLSNVQPGFLDGHIAPLQKRINEILKTEHLASGGLESRIRILKMAARNSASDFFQVVADATIQRKRISIVYHGRERDAETIREVSPQRLTYYRDNWYLDALCHMREELRSFSIDRIKKACVLKKKAKNVSERKLDQYFTESYGIFAGKPKHKAVLRFSKNVSKWVANENWHPKQKGRFIDGGEYELEIPFSDSRELVMDVLKYGADVEVKEPKLLKNIIANKLKGALNQY